MYGSRGMEPRRPRLVEAADALFDLEACRDRVDVLQRRLAQIHASLDAALIVAGFDDMEEEYRLHAVAALVRSSKDILEGKS